MIRRTSVAACALCALIALSAHVVRGQATSQPSIASREDVAKLAPTLAQQLRAGGEAQTKALDTIRRISKLSARSLSDNLPQWLDPLHNAKQYQDIRDLTFIAITDRAYDIVFISQFQKARVRALMAESKYDAALGEAKGYYNLVTLKDTPDAINLLVEVLEKAQGASAAARFKIEQIQMADFMQPPTSRPASAGHDHPDHVLTSIKVDPLLYEAAIQGLEARKNGLGQYSHSSLLARGNLLLLSDRSLDARQCFEAACAAADNKAGKPLREAVEGIARSIKARPDGSVAKANAFVTSIRANPEMAGIALTVPISDTDLRTAARQTVLAPVKTMTVPPLEEKRVAESKPFASSADLVKVSSDFETATRMRSRMVSPSHLELTFVDTMIHGWFMFRLEGVKDKILRIDLSHPFDQLDKWISFNPVYTSAPDLADPGLFLASKPNDGEPPIAAWNGNGSLLPNTSGQKWNYIPDVWRVSSNAIGFVQKFDADSVYVAMRVPYTPALNERYFKELSANPHVNVVEVGKSKQDQRLLMARIGAGNGSSVPKKPCIFIYGGEHPDEHDAMWTAYGALEFLAGESPEAAKLRDRFTFLVIPMLDPDGTKAGRHEGMYRTFLTDLQTPETIAYANWFQQWVNANNRLDLVLNFHNVQSMESGHVACALIEGLGERGELSMNLHGLLVSQFHSAGLSASPAPWGRGWSPNRLGGWLSRRYGPIGLAYELNSQSPDRHLTLKEMKEHGGFFTKGAATFLTGADGAILFANVDARRRERSERWAKSGSIGADLDAISAEAKVSYGIGRNMSPMSPPAEKWVP